MKNEGKKANSVDSMCLKPTHSNRVDFLLRWELIFKGVVDAFNLGLVVQMVRATNS